jgi:hypothetical protein
MQGGPEWPTILSECGSEVSDVFGPDRLWFQAATAMAPFTNLENLTLTTGHREVFRRDQVVSLSPEFHALIDRSAGAIPGLLKPFRFLSEVGKGQAVLDVVWKEASRLMTSNHLCWDASLADAVWDTFGARYAKTQKGARGVALGLLTRPATVPFMLSLMTADYAKVVEDKDARQVTHAITHFGLARAWSILDRAVAGR